MSDRSELVVLSWIRYHGRSQGLADALGGTAVFISCKGPLPLRYMRQFVQTRTLLSRIRPRVLIVMLPPAPALWASLSAPGRGKRSVWVDAHTGVFEDPKWRWLKIHTLRLTGRRCAGLIVTNEALAHEARKDGVHRIAVLDDLLVPGEASGGAQQGILFPVSYANDEPIKNILDAALRCPEIEFHLTGTPPKRVVESAPANVRFTGYVSNDEYRALVANCMAIGALTTRPRTMQRAGYEAIESGVPLLTTDTEVLRAYFGEAAIYADTENSVESIVSGIKRIREEEPELRSKMRELRDRKVREQATLLRLFSGILRESRHA